MLVAGEPSGDMEAGALGKSLQELDPSVRLMGIGGRHLKNTGAQVFFDSSMWSAIGIFDAFTKIAPLVLIFQKVCSLLAQEVPDVLVLIDCPAFNLPLAKFAKKSGIPTIYFFPPSQWSRNPKRLKEISDSVTKVVAVFPFTALAYQEAGLEVSFYGHPILDLARPTKTCRELCLEYNIDPTKRLITIMPGSRTQEIRYLLDSLLSAAKLIQKTVPNLHFLLPVATESIFPIIKKALASHQIPATLAVGETYNFINASELVLVTSGSATLETACFLKPMVIVYKLSWFSWYLAKLIVKCPYAGLPNLIAKEQIVPELLQKDANPERIAYEAITILNNPKKQEEMMGKLRRVVETLGKPGIIAKVAQLVMDISK